MSLEYPSDPREALEASLTALALGELTPDQEAFVRQAMAQDPELAGRYERLKQTIEMVRLAEADPAGSTAKPPVALKLGDERRQILLGMFRTVAPPQFSRTTRHKIRWVIPTAIAALFVAVCGMALLPMLSRSKSRSMAYRSGPFGGISLVEREQVERLGAKLENRNGVVAPREKPPQAPPAVMQPEVQTRIVLPSTAPGSGDSLQAASQKGWLGRAAAPSAPGVEWTYNAPAGAGGQSGASSKPAELAQQEVNRQIAGRRYLRRYGLLGGGAPTTSVEKAAADEKPKALADQEPVVDPVTGLPLEASQQSVASADGSKPWSISSSLRGFYQSNATAGDHFAQGSNGPEVAARSDLAVTQLPVDSAPNIQQQLPSLGDEPTLGKLFQRGEVAGRQEKLSEDAPLRDGAGAQTAIAQDTRSENYVVAPQSATQALPNLFPAYYAAPGLTTSAGEPSSDFYKSNGSQFGEPALVSKDGTLALNFGQQTAGDRSSLTYDAKKSELDTLQKGQEVLRRKLAAEVTDQSLPHNNLVAIVDRAVPAERPKEGFLARVLGTSGGKFESTARVRVDTEANSNSFYDPYFVQNETEVLQSDVILGRVADKLNLQSALANEEGKKQPMRTEEAIQTLRRKLDIKVPKGTSLLEIHARDAQSEEAAKIANSVAEEYLNYRQAQHPSAQQLTQQLQAKQKQIAAVTEDLVRLQSQTNMPADADASLPKPAVPPPVPQPEVQTTENAFSTFSLNVSDVSFKLAAASLEKGVMPEPAGIRAEEFINAFDYRDPEPAPGAPLAFAWERAHSPFAHNRDLLRLSIKTAAQGRQSGKPLNLVLLLDNSGSMERADRVRIIHEALRVLAAQLQPQDTLSVVTFARTAQLWVDGIPGNQAAQVAEEVGGLTPQGGTNLEEAMNLAYQTALRHYRADGLNRVVLLTDGAANLGDVSADSLKNKVEANRKQGIALDCFGIGWDGYNDDLLEALTRNGDGRYGFLNTPEEVAAGFADQLAGALKVAASDVKVQVEFNPKRVTTYRQIGYAKHQLTAEQFRDNTVDAAELGAAESGNALYVVQVNPAGEGDLATVRVRFKVPGTSEYREYAWSVPFTGTAPVLEQASPAMRLTATAAGFAEWLASSPYAGEISPSTLLGYLNGIPEVYGHDTRPQVLGSMLREAKALSGK